VFSGGIEVDYVDTPAISGTKGKDMFLKDV
jgi:hypothetical protein